MKIGVFSDIHGNLFAFDNIYRELLKEKCDLYLFLGDICGYYYRQKEIIDMLRDMPHLETIAGNHDVLFLKALDEKNTMNRYTEKYGLSFQFLKETIDSKHLDFLRNLPKEFHLDTGEIAAFHGSPWDPMEEYIYPDSPMERFSALPFNVVFLGHTHYSMDIKLQGTPRRGDPLRAAAMNHILAISSKAANRNENSYLVQSIRVINPGSAGQPRNGDWPTYALYDTQTDKLEIKPVHYNVNELVDEIKQRKDENPYLIRVLQRIKGWQN